MHLIVMGPKHSGKSLLLNGLHSKSKENRDIFSGSSSTLKSLVPSFKYNPARLGYLAESNRFAFCDEFFRCLISARTTKEGSVREESVAMMNDLLEHQKRRAGSGVSSVNVNMTSRVIATTNPIKGMKNIPLTFAKCCNPILGNDIGGFITKLKGISIHEKNCLQKEVF